MEIIFLIFLTIKNMTDIWSAAENGKISVIKKLLEEGIDINLQDSEGWTALMFASRFSDNESSLEIVKLLIDSGADLNLQDIDGMTALMLACEPSNTNSSLEIAKLLINSGADLNIKSNNGWTALMVASSDSNTDGKSSLETVKLLIDSGADLNLKNNMRYTALMLASKYSNTDSSLETIKLLIDSGADLNLQDYYGRTVLMLAKSIEKVLLLLDHGANPFIDTQLLSCKSEDCLRAVETAAWKQLWKRDLQTAQILGKSILNKEVWQLILLNERQRMLCNNLESSTNKYLLEEFAKQLGADSEKVRNMSKGQLCGLISRSIGRSNVEAEKDIKKAKIELEKRKKQIIKLAKTFNIDTDRDLSKIIADISKRL